MIFRRSLNIISLGEKMVSKCYLKDVSKVFSGCSNVVVRVVPPIYVNLCIVTELTSDQVSARFLMYLNFVSQREIASCGTVLGQSSCYMCTHWSVVACRHFTICRLCCPVSMNQLGVFDKTDKLWSIYITYTDASARALHELFLSAGWNIF